MAIVLFFTVVFVLVIFLICLRYEDEIDFAIKTYLNKRKKKKEALSKLNELDLKYFDLVCNYFNDFENLDTNYIFESTCHEVVELDKFDLFFVYSHYYKYITFYFFEPNTVFDLYKDYHEEKEDYDDLLIKIKDKSKYILTIQEGPYLDLIRNYYQIAKDFKKNDFYNQIK